MKTFLETIQSSDDNTVLKSYKVDGVEMDFTARQFKSLLKIDPKSLKTFVSMNENADLIGTLNIVRENIMSVTVMKECGDCGGKGNYECRACSATGECDCSECGNLHDCGMCNEGYVDCEECGASEFDEEEILFYCEIDLNQGELLV